MEFLPDELLIIIFRYLHRFDLIYSFDNLNQRFQRIIEPYLNCIDLIRENPSFKLFLHFSKHILPVYGHKIRELKLPAECTYHLLSSYVQYLTNLESLTWNSCTLRHDSQCSLQKQILSKILKMNSISKLSTSTLSYALASLVTSFASKNLTTLIVLDESTLKYRYESWKGIAHNLYSYYDTIQMHGIKFFSMTLREFDSTTLTFICDFFPNLEGLKLSISEIRFDPSDNLYKISVPRTLESLYLEFKQKNELSCKILKKKFLDVFNNQLRSLTLIITNAAREFFDYEKCNGLMSDCARLETFQYYIRSHFQPDSRFPNVECLLDSTYIVFTLPLLCASCPVSEIQRIVDFYENITVENLLNCDSLSIDTRNIPQTMFQIYNIDRLLHLNTLKFNFSEKSSKPEEYQFLSRLISLSPNLNTLFIYDSDSKIIIEQLKNILPKKSSNKIIYCYIEESLKCGDSHVWTPNTTKYHAAFFYELSQILSNLNILGFQSDEQFAEEYLTVFTTFVKDIKSYFPRLTHLKLEVVEGKDSMFNNYKKDLDECDWLNYTTQLKYYQDYDGWVYNVPEFDIWF
ncbi:unnamed protein product [Rotaria sp. Silwood2]|nr:unnamed protein product [Rotaria sp. Silwood2]